MRWGAGIGVCALGLTLFLVFFMPAEDSHRSLPGVGTEIRICEARVRRVNMAYMVGRDGAFLNAQRQAVRAEVAALLAPARVPITDRGIVPRLNCASLEPGSPEELTVLLLERGDHLYLATIHFRPDSGICRTGEIDPSRLQAILFRQRMPLGLHELNAGTLRTWGENLPRALRPDCREGYPLPGANNVDPRNQRAISIPMP